MKNNMIVLGLSIWNNLQDILLSENSKRQNNICSVFLFIWEKNKHTHSYTRACVCLYASLLVHVRLFWEGYSREWEQWSPLGETYWEAGVEGACAFQIFCFFNILNHAYSLKE